MTVSNSLQLQVCLCQEISGRGLALLAVCLVHSPQVATTTGFKIDPLFTVTAVAVETAAPLHMQMSGWRFAGVLLKKHLEG